MKKTLAAVSALTIAVLYGLLGAVIALLCAISDVPAYWAVLPVAAILLLQFFLSPWLTDLNMKWFYKADFNAEIPEYLTAFIQQVSEEKQMECPRIAVIPDGAPNAFTYGHTKNDARIVLTRGIFDLLTEEEVKAVAAHELGHAVHYDMLLMTAIQIVPSVLYAIYDTCRRLSRTVGGKKSSNSKGNSAAALAVVALVSYALYVISEYIILWFSRTREYYADEFAARQTANPNALASALVAIGFGLSTHKQKEASQGRHSVTSPSTLGISDTKTSTGLTVSCWKDGELSRDAVKDAMKWDLWNIWAKLYELKSTHPLISKRILALGKLSQEFGQEPYVDFDLKKPESYADDFFREVMISFLPAICVIAGVIVGFMLAYRGDSVNTGMTAFAAGLVLAVLASLGKHRYTHPKDFEVGTVRSLLGVVKVSGITSIPCELNGRIIGRGNPGCIFNEDFVLEDGTGIIMLDYNQPLRIINKLFALFKSKEYFDKTVHVRGWYRRSPVPFVELLDFEVDGEVKKCHTVKTGYIVRFILLGLALVFFAFALSTMF